MATPDYTALAHSFGLFNATYPVPQAFAHWGVKHTLGWELIKRHAVRAIALTSKKVVIPASEIARVLHEREHAVTRRPRGKNARVAS